MKYKLTDIYKQIREEETAAQVSQYKIFCDMDGVLCDFDRRFEHHLSGNWLSFHISGRRKVYL